MMISLVLQDSQEKLLFSTMHPSFPNVYMYNSVYPRIEVKKLYSFLPTSSTATSLLEKWIESLNFICTYDRY